MFSLSNKEVQSVSGGVDEKSPVVQGALLGGIIGGTAGLMVSLSNPNQPGSIVPTTLTFAFLGMAAGALALSLYDEYSDNEDDHHLKVKI